MYPPAKVLLIGWDAADWKVIRPLLDRGEMPNLAKLIEDGVHGNLATLYPPLSPILWTSIATGKRATKHGVLGFLEPIPDGSRFGPVSNLGRKTKAIWNILHQAGKRSVVVGWWPSHPAEPIRGAMVSNHFAGIEPQPFPFPPLPKRCVHPPEWVDRLAELRVHPTELEGEILRLFVPEFEKIDQSSDQGLHKLALLVSHAMSVHAAATEILENEPWDFAAVYFDSIDHFSHRFMSFHPPKLRWVPQDKFEIYQHVVSNAYRYHDAMLGRYLELAGSDAHVIVMSDHGFHSDHHRRAHIPAEVAGPAAEHRHFGILCAKGPQIKKGEIVYGASLLDVAPTLLQLFGLPTGRDMDGKVLNAIFREPRPSETIPSWDDVPGEAGLHPPEMQLDPISASEGFRQLVELGYIAPPGKNRTAELLTYGQELRYNQARVHLDARRPDLAEPILVVLHEEDPIRVGVAECLLQCLLARGAMDQARRLLESYDELCERTAIEAAREWERKQAESPLESLQPDSNEYERELYDRRQLAERARGYMIQRQMMRLQFAVTALPPAEAANMLDGIAAALPAAELGGLAIHLAGAYLQAARSESALHWCAKALEEDPEEWHAWGFRASIYFAQKRWSDAFDAAVESLSLVHYQPQLHLLVAKSLVALRKWKEAEKEFRVAIIQAPGMAEAFEALADLYQGPLGRPQDAITLRLHAKQASDRREKRAQDRMQPPPPAEAPSPPRFVKKWTQPEPERDIVIVSGLPRSGTSMMMRMLTEGGLAAYTDGLRQPDEDNPRGYFEAVQASQLAQDNSWIPQARGRAVKIVAPLLSKLPRGERYRIILMQRDFSAMLASQRVMIERQGGKEAEESALRITYARWLREAALWMNSRHEVAVLPCMFDDVLAHPGETAHQIAEFLGCPFDTASASAAVEPALRHHTGSETVHAT